MLLRKTVEVRRFKEKCEEAHLTDLEAFETAYMTRFGHQGHVTPDYITFIETKELPRYVLWWLGLENMNGSH